MLGRKRHLLVDSVGLPITNTITPANIHDSKAAPEAIQKAKQKEPELALLIGDKAYKGEPIQLAARSAGVRFDVVGGQPSSGKFVPIKNRWKVERSIAWHGRNRRLSRDYERSMKSSESVMTIASIGILLRRAAA